MIITKILYVPDKNKFLQLAKMSSNDTWKKNCIQHKSTIPNIVIEEKLEDSKHHKGGAGFTRMHSCRKKYHLLPGKAVGSWCLLCLWEET